MCRWVRGCIMRTDCIGMSHTRMGHSRWLFIKQLQTTITITSAYYTRTNSWVGHTPEWATHPTPTNHDSNHSHTWYTHELRSMSRTQTGHSLNNYKSRLQLQLRIIHTRTHLPHTLYTHEITCHTSNNWFDPYPAVACVCVCVGARGGERVIEVHSSTRTHTLSLSRTHAHT